jgi:hypothetical protein
VSIGLPFGRVFPVPDGSITSADFEQESYLYRGIQSGEAVAAATPIDFILLMRRRRR